MLKRSILLIAMLFIALQIQAANDPIYKYNTQNKKYHKITCKWAVKCTKNCVEKKLSEIKKIGGIPCKTCNPK